MPLILPLLSISDARPNFHFRISIAAYNQGGEKSMSECSRLADQIRRAFAGENWHDGPLFAILEGVTAEMAAERPIAKAHTIWEILLHIAAWDKAVTRRLAGEALELSDEENFPPIPDKSEAAWQRAIASVQSTHAALVQAVEAFPDARLLEHVPGKKQPYYNFFYMLSGIAQHEVYHAGQILILKRAQS
jgi:uncharacterized damage-inducible protein DinB